MKRAKNLYHDLTIIPNILAIYEHQIRLNTKNKKKLERFEEMYVQNITQIHNVLSSRTYRVGKYNIFLITKPKLRIIMSQEIRDKIVNHLVAKYFLSNILDKTLLDCNVATRPNKGTHYGIGLTKKYIRELHRKSPIFYILKFDISKYFYSIDHEIIKDLLRKKIKDSDALKLLFDIIDSTDEPYVNDRIQKLKDRYRKKIMESNIMDKEKRLSDIEKIPFYQKGKGLPIGNMTSQILAIYYLNELDHFIKEKLKIAYYVRYMDDGILMHEDKAYLEYCLEEIQKVLERYKLRLNRKTVILNSKNGLTFLGFRFVLYHDRLVLKVEKKTRQKFKHKMKKLYRLKRNGFVTDKDVSQVLASYVGHLSHGNSYEVVHRTLESLEGVGEEAAV